MPARASVKFCPGVGAAGRLTVGLGAGFSTGSGSFGGAGSGAAPHHHQAPPPTPSRPAASAVASIQARRGVGVVGVDTGGGLTLGPSDGRGRSPLRCNSERSDRSSFTVRSLSSSAMGASSAVRICAID